MASVDVAEMRPAAVAIHNGYGLKLKEETYELPDKASFAHLFDREGTTPAGLYFSGGIFNAYFGLYGDPPLFSQSETFQSGRGEALPAARPARRHAWQKGPECAS